MTKAGRKAYDLATRQLFKKLFERKWDPEHWATSAENLHHAATVLFRLHDTARAETGEPLDPENLELDKPAMLLYGYAMENAIKGVLIKKQKLLPKDFDGSKSQFAKSWKGHDLATLWQHTGIEQHWQDGESVLAMLSAYVIWAGKYPTAIRFAGHGGFIVQKQPGSASDTPPGVLDKSMRDTTDNVFRKLIAAISANSSK